VGAGEGWLFIVAKELLLTHLFTAEDSLEYNIAVILINESETVSDCYYEQTQIPVVGKYLITYKHI
jgi:hypothetical protein